LNDYNPRVRLFKIDLVSGHIAENCDAIRKAAVNHSSSPNRLVETKRRARALEG
jgi:hypothetical protein